MHRSRITSLPKCRETLTRSVTSAEIMEVGLNNIGLELTLWEYFGLIERNMNLESKDQL